MLQYANLHHARHDLERRGGGCVKDFQPDDSYNQDFLMSTKEDLFSESIQLKYFTTECLKLENKKKLRILINWSF